MRWKWQKNRQIWTKNVVNQSFTVLNTWKYILMWMISYSDTVLALLYSFQRLSKIIGVDRPPKPPILDPKWSQNTNFRE